MKHIALATLLTLLLAAAVAVVVASWWRWPTLRIEIRPGAAVVHTELMGESPTDLESIEVREEKSNKLIWRAVAEEGMFQMHSLALGVGENRTQPSVYWGRLHSIEPTSSPSFALVRDTSYLVRVCSSFYVSLCSSRVFDWPSQ